MDHYRDARYQQLREEVRCFAERELAPFTQELDRTGFSREHYRKVMDSGLVGAPAAVEHGGQAVGTIGRCIIIEEIARACPSTSLTYLVGGMGLYPKAGTAEQMQRYYLPWVQGKLLPAFCLTEEQAGSDVRNQAMTAVKDGDSYILNGKKTLVVNGISADLFHVYALTDTAVPAHKGMSVFAVEKGTAGMHAEKQETMCLRGTEIAAITFTDCRIPASALIGEEGCGYRYAMDGIAGGRINAAASSLGIAQQALEAATAYAKTRVQFKKPIMEQQGLGWQLAEMKTKLAAARALVYETAALMDANSPEAAEYAAMAKLQATEAAQFCADKCLTIHGGFGCTTACTAERIYRDAHAARIYDGTTEILKLIVARSL